MLHTKFHQNQPIGSWKEDFKVFYHIWVWQPSWSCDQHNLDEFFISLYLQAYIQNLAENGPEVNEKSNFHM